MNNKEDKLLEFYKRKVHDYPREIPPMMVVKGAMILMLGPFLLLAILLLYKHIEIEIAFWSLIFLFCISLVFILPYIANLSALTNYVKALATSKNAQPPNLSFLNNVEQLQEAVEGLQLTWEAKGKQLEDTLEESKILINTLPDIIVMLDKDHKVINTNTTAKLVFGSLYYKDYLEQIIQNPEISSLIEKVSNEDVGDQIVYDIHEPFNRHYMIRIEPFPAHSTSQIKLILAIHDITAQKLTEKMLSDFVANASHEIRTPLTSVIGYIETLQTSAKNDPEMSKRFLKIMHQQADRIAKLVEDLLSLSEVEKTIGTKPHSTLHIGNLLKEVETHANHDALKKQMKVVLDIKTKRIPKIIGEHDQLKRAFDNLVSNAIKYGKEKTTVMIELKVIDNNRKEASLQSYTKLISVAITDEGEGISEEHISRLTERFYRVDTARSRKIGGSGLGLAITQQILERHNSILDISSEVGKGSCFKVLLPIPSKEQKAEARVLANL